MCILLFLHVGSQGEKQSYIISYRHVEKNISRNVAYAITSPPVLCPFETQTYAVWLRKSLAAQKCPRSRKVGRWSTAVHTFIEIHRHLHPDHVLVAEGPSRASRWHRATLDRRVMVGVERDFVSLLCRDDGAPRGYVCGRAYGFIGHDGGEAQSGHSGETGRSSVDECGAGPPFERVVVGDDFLLAIGARALEQARICRPRGCARFLGEGAIGASGVADRVASVRVFGVNLEWGIWRRYVGVWYMGCECECIDVAGQNVLRMTR